MKDVIKIWKSKVNDRHKLINKLTALKHYKQTLISKAFTAFKQTYTMTQALKRIE